MDKRFVQESGHEAFTGNELLLKGALEAGVGLLTGYPGSPVSEVFDSVGSISELLLEKGILAQMANNEGLSAARLNGARMAEIRAMTIMKSVGFHVAADGLAIGNLAEPRKPGGGALIVIGDDPWNETTQINSDSRYLSQHLNIPLIEPSTFQEIKDWIKDGLELSGHSDLYMAYIITTNQADGGGVVTCRPNLYPVINRLQKTVLSSANMPVHDMVMIPPHTSWREATLAARFERLMTAVRQKNLNRIHWSKPGEHSSVGFVSSGLPFCYLTQALEQMGLGGKFPVLKWGMTYPLDDQLLVDFARNVDQIFVVEEKRDFVETQTVRILQRAVQSGRLPRMVPVWGKKFPDEKEGVPTVRGINASVLVERLAPIFRGKTFALPRETATILDEALRTVQETATFTVSIPVRTPTFCPGCPHRDSATVSKAMKKDFLDPVYMLQKHNSKPVDVIFHGESGCHSMLQFEPNLGLMQDYSGMGLGGGTGAGISPFIKNKQVVFLGDSTFFHSGMLAVSDSIKNRQDITYIILENKTTAMTGHQPTPGTELDLMRQPTFAQSIEHLIRGMARDTVPIHRVNPAYRDSYRALIEDLVLKDGVKVIIADKECGITYQRRVRRERKKIIKDRGYLPEERVINITPEACEHCLECTTATGCPGLNIEDTLHGPKIITDRSLCIADAACTRGKTCPSFEEIIIRRQARPLAKSEEVATDLPLPTIKTFSDAWYCYAAGVGGMGAGIVTSVLVRAGMREGYHVLFADKKGLAIRNGGVYGHVIFSKHGEQTLAPLVPYGRADLFLGIDLLESVRGLDPKINLRVASPTRTVAIVNTRKMPTVRALLGLDEIRTDELEGFARQYTRADQFIGLDFAGISEEYFGNKLYANILLLGVAFQRGLLPVRLENLLDAVAAAVPSHELEENIKAIHLGRHIAAAPEKFRQFGRKLPGYFETLQDKASLLQRRWNGKRLAREYRKMVEDAIRWIDLDELHRAKLAQFVYDLIQFDGLSYAQRYLQRLWTVYKKDHKDRGYAATRAVLDNLYKAMLIKDEVYVAHLLTAEEKFRRDREFYRVDEKRGDRMEYIHINRPQFNILGKNIVFNIRSRNWQLRIMKELGFLRRLLPEWHAKEKAFRAWYEALVDGFNFFTSEDSYRLYTEALKSPADVRGYREIRWSKMDAARAKAESFMVQLQSRRTGTGAVSPSVSQDQ